LPVTLLQHLMKELTHSNPPVTMAAIGIDARNTSRQLQKLPNVLRDLIGDGVDSQVIYLDADDETLIKRFSETRRKHPISSDTKTLREAIERERDMLNPVASSASLIIDTSTLTLHQLRDLIKVRVGEAADTMAVLVESFGFKNGIPKDADLVFDVRCLPNPHWITHLRAKTGLEQDVQDFLAGHETVGEMIADILAYLDKWLPRFAANNRSYMTVAIGCTGGQHRSVYITEILLQHLRQRFSNVQARHREL
ncbi:MAG TPA: RNase adapter RapZ, partial [Candidatus Kapabacteria bacterium]|nr:RNase adapter RapZ [Candidatus Kapabacteria bacterium]